MEFYTALFVVNAVILFLIFLSSPNVTPVRGEPSSRLFGIFATKDVILTIISGVVVGLLSDTKYIMHGILWQFVIGTAIHIALGVKTMPLYMLGISAKPDGTGRLAHPVSD